MTNLNLKVWLPIAILILSLCSIGTAQEKKKLAYGILVDNTGSMRSQFDNVITIAKSVVDQIHDHGPVSIFDFHSQGPGRANALPIARIEGSRDQQLLLRAIDNLYVEGGQTTLLDAIDFMRENLNQKSPDADKVIILITDGEERSSNIKQKQLIADLKKQTTTIFAIGLVQELNDHRSRAAKLLQTLAGETGGRAIFPKSIRDFDLKALAIPIQ